MIQHNQRYADISHGADVLEWQLPRTVLDELLMDRTTGKHIVWGTKDYERQYGAGKGFGEDDEICAEQLVDRDHPVIRPRTVKSKEEQRQRVAEKAEVFTPAWICNQQNNLVDVAWFGAKTSPFNVETFDRKTGMRGWRSTVGKPIVRFPKGKGWIDYVLARRLEVSCGEAPYLTSRYDAVSGEMIPVSERIGLLDRKLRLIGENATPHGTEYWFDMAKWAVRSVYGFDWQGDNVLLARENVLFTVMEHFNDDFGTTGMFTEKSMRELAEIISWNIWQMDGIKFVVPNSCEKQKDMLGNPIPCPGCKKHQIANHIGWRCRVMDWMTGKEEDFLPGTNTRAESEKRRRPI